MTSRDRSPAPLHPRAPASLLPFLAELYAAYPEWRQRDLIAHLRRAIPGYAEGVWTASMPLNAGPSALPPPLRRRFVRLLRRHTAETGVDLGHVIVCLDLALNPDTIDDRYASWAGDLGLHALSNYARRRDVPIDLPDTRSHANRSDLLADLDGDVLARRLHLWPGRELDAVFAYYAPLPEAEGVRSPSLREGLGEGAAQNPLPAPLSEGEGVQYVIHVSRRFSLFLADNDLLDEDGHLRRDAAAPDGPLHPVVRRYVFWEQMKNHLARFRPGRMARLAARATLADTPELRAEISWVVEQFVDFLRAGQIKESTDFTDFTD